MTCKIKTATWQTIHGILQHLTSLTSIQWRVCSTHHINYFKKWPQMILLMQTLLCTFALSSFSLFDTLEVYYTCSTRLFMSFCGKSLMFVNPIYILQDRKEWKGYKHTVVLLCLKCKHEIRQISILKNNIMYK